jgi:uncharacterized protein (UPF0335 family)
VDRDRLDAGRANLEGALIFQPHLSSYQEYKMATPAAAVQDEPATKFAKDQLKAITERIERLEEEKKTISDDIRDVNAEAKAMVLTSRRCTIIRCASRRQRAC